MNSHPERLLLPFLETVLSAQSETDYRKGSQEITTFIKGFEDPSQVLRLANSVIETYNTSQEDSSIKQIILPRLQPAFSPSEAFYNLFNVFSGDTPRFIRHYYEGGGTPVDLADWGLLDTYRNAPEVLRGASQFAHLARDEVNRQPSTITRITGEFQTNVNAEPVIFSMGNSNLKLNYTATIDRNNPQPYRFTGAPGFISYPYRIELRYSVNDEFVDALDSFDSVDGNQEFPGNPTPYPN